MLQQGQLQALAHRTRPSRQAAPRAGLLLRARAPSLLALVPSAAAVVVVVNVEVEEGEAVEEAASVVVQAAPPAVPRVSSGLAAPSQ